MSSDEGTHSSDINLEVKHNITDVSDPDVVEADAWTKVEARASLKATRTKRSAAKKVNAARAESMLPSPATPALPIFVLSPSLTKAIDAKAKVCKDPTCAIQIVTPTSYDGAFFKFPADQIRPQGSQANLRHRNEVASR